MTTANARVYQQVQDALQGEVDALRRLLRLSHRQQRYLVKGQPRRIRWNLESTANAVEAARNAALLRRTWMQQLGLAPDEGAPGLKRLVEVADDSSKGAIESLVTELSEVATRLGQQNLQNYQLARFSADLTAEEMRILVGGSPESGSTYTHEGATVDAELLGSLDGRA